MPQQSAEEFADWLGFTEGPTKDHAVRAIERDRAAIAAEARGKAIDECANVIDRHLHDLGVIEPEDEAPSHTSSMLAVVRGQFRALKETP